jgi:hypothetical protein
MSVVFINMQFTSLDANCSAVSMGLTDMEGNAFYGEFEDYDPQYMDEWARENLPQGLLIFNPSMTINADDVVIGDRETVALGVSNWLEQYDSVELWGDASSYIMVGFDALFGGWHERPENIYHTSFDIATYMKVKGVDMDAPREDFIESSMGGVKHNALYNARIIKACYEKLISME